jgi:hypothetical protein
VCALRCVQSGQEAQAEADMSTYHAIPADDRACLESAERMLAMDRSEMTVTDIVLMVYNLGRISGRAQQLERCDAIVRDVYADAMIQRDKMTRHTGTAEHDKDARGNPL